MAKLGQEIFALELTQELVNVVRKRKSRGVHIGVVIL